MPSYWSKVILAADAQRPRRQEASAEVLARALAGVDPQLYEALAIDGGTRWQRLRYVTLPCITPIIMIVLIIRVGQVLNVGFEHIFLLLNSSTEPVAQVLDTYVYTRGIVDGNLSYATAIGLTKGLAGLVLIVISNALARRFGEGGIF